MTLYTTLILSPLCTIFFIECAKRPIILRHDPDKQKTFIMLENQSGELQLPSDYTRIHKTNIMDDVSLLEKLPHSGQQLLLASPTHQAFNKESNCSWVDINDIKINYTQHNRLAAFIINSIPQPDTKLSSTIVQEHHALKKWIHIFVKKEPVNRSPAPPKKIYTTGILCVAKNRYGLFHVLLKQLPFQNAYTIPTHMYRPRFKDPYTIARQALIKKTYAGFGDNIDEHNEYIEKCIRKQPFELTIDLGTQINTQQIFPAYIPDMQQFREKQGTLPTPWIPITDIYCGENDRINLALTTDAFFKKSCSQLITFIAMHVVKEENETTLLPMEK